MYLEEALDLAAKKLKALSSKYSKLESWTIKTDRARRRAGSCRASEKIITLSEFHIKHNVKEIVLDTILHEIAHAICFEYYSDISHGKNWKKIATEIGATPKSKGHFQTPGATWIIAHVDIENKSVKHVADRFRRTKRLSDFYIKNDPSTKGQLYYLTTEEYNLYSNGDIEFTKLNFHQ